MNRYINTKNINFKGKFSCGLNDNGILYVPFREIQKIVEDVPTADVEAVRHGEWIPIEQTKHWAETGIVSINIIGFHCSLCGAEEKFKYKYCHCGAKMDKGSDINGRL